MRASRRPIEHRRPRRPATRRALLVGIDRYPRLGPLEQLRGARRDAEEMADLLRARFGFAPRDLQLLRDEEATRDATLRALDALVDDAGPGDLVVVFWSGHGSQLVEEPGECDGGAHLEPDGLHETLVPFDGHRHPPYHGREKEGDEIRDVLDAEIRLRIHRLHEMGAFASLIFDTCHAGHVHRAGGGPRARSLPPIERTPIETTPPVPAPTHSAGPSRGSRRRWRGGPGTRQVILAACRDHEKAWERALGSSEPVDGDPVDGDPVRGDVVHGHFTHGLLRELRSPDAPSHAVDVLRRVRARVLAESPRQTPQIAGAGQRLLFGVAARPFRPYVRVVRTEADGGLELDAGRLHDLRAGSRWALHPPGTVDPSGSAPLARVVIEEVGSVRSRVRLARNEKGDRAGDATAIPTDAHAYLERAATEERRLAVELADAGDERLAELVRSSPLLRLARNEVDQADVRVHRLPRGRVAEGPLAELGATQAPVRVLADATGHPFAVLPAVAPPAAILERLGRRARRLRGLGVENRDPATAVPGLELALLRRDGRSWTRERSAELPAFRDGERIAFEIVHRHAEPLYVYLVDFGLTDRVRQIHPLRGAEELLDPGRRLRVGVADDDPVTLHLPDDFGAAPTPEWRRASGVEIFVLFASEKPADLRPLLTPETGVLRRTAEGAWGTEQAALELRRRAAS